MFTKALFDGTLLDGVQVYDMIGGVFHQGQGNYGLGMEIYEEDGPEEEFGKLGSLPGYATRIGYRDDLDVAIAITANGRPGGNADFAHAIAADLWSVIEGHVDPPMGDDDDDFAPLEDPDGFQRLWVFPTFNHPGEAPDSEHTGIRITGTFNFDNDGETLGQYRLISGDFNGTSPNGSTFECTFVSNGNYDPSDGKYNSTGSLNFENFQPPNCAEWPQASDTYYMMNGDKAALTLVPVDYVDGSWMGSWNGVEEDLGGVGSIQEYMENWMANEGVAEGASGITFLVLAHYAGMTSIEPQVDPLSFFGFMWQRPGDG